MSTRTEAMTAPAARDLPAETLLKVEGLQTFLKTGEGTVRAVDGVDIEIYPGEAVGIVGESGCGKSMTAMSIMGLVPSPPGKIVGGRVLFRGEDLLALAPQKMRNVRGHHLAMIFQDPMTYLNPVLTIGVQIGEMLSWHLGMKDKERDAKVLELLAQVRIPDPARVAASYPHQLSGGMRQRVLIATALSCGPRLLIADEPTTALDVTIQAQILDLMREIIRETGTSLLLITHDLGVVAETCNRVYVMYAGRVVEAADVAMLFHSPRHPYTIGLLRSILRSDQENPELYALEGTVPNLIDASPGCRFADRCPRVMDICRRETPPWKGMPPNDGVACWLYK